jgi:hypothetical protein
MYWVYEQVDGSGNWVQVGQMCLSPEDPAARRRARPAVTAEDFRRLPLPAGRVRVQPASGRTLVNVPTNVYVEAPVAVLPATVLGAGVRVRATPVEFVWGFGDGGRLRTGDPGAPYPDLRTTHTYTAPGSVRLSLTTVYRGEFSVDGGAWLPIEGTASVDSPTQVLTVVAARAELVDDTVPAA